MQGDAGQAFPVYIAVVAGLLFLGFAYFAVGQAASTRNSAQTAADAAVLAAALDAREQLRDGWLEVILDPDQWGGFIEGEAYVDSSSACRNAAEFASRNRARLADPPCERLSSEGNGFRVTVLTAGGEADPAKASAEAVIEPRCTFEEQEPEPTVEPSTSPPSPPPSGEPQEEDPGPILGLFCDGKPWEIDPADPRLPTAAELFTVRLSE
ncbi:pilus assembly protein TadG-related protein [Streptomyces sp. NPDC058671]|uniref:pilus assembly protein TadG-related protein n=1 Tax=Streptomyces sp. NPDC058671 TaxID=3346590 RepID=UPI0036694CA9